MPFEHEKYNMKAVSKLLGIQPGTLRAWERRYKIIAPERNKAGHRIYTEKHITILKWLLNKINEGFTISQAVSLLEKNEAEDALLREMQTNKHNHLFHKIKSKLLHELLNFDEDQARKLFDYALSLFSFETVVIDLIGSIFTEMNVLSQQKKISSAQEQYIYNYFRTKLGTILQTLPYDSYIQQKVIAVCGPNEKHELGLLIFSLFLRSKGFKVIYLGTSVKEEDLFGLINEIKPAYLFTSFTMNNDERARLFIEKLASQFVGLHIGIGGRAVQSLADELGKEYQSFLIGPTISEWEEWFKK